MPPKKQKGGKGKNDDWDDDAAEKKLAKLTMKEEVEKEEFSESEEEEPAPKPKNRMAAFMMAEESEKESDDQKSEDEEPAKEKAPIKAEPKKEKKDNKKKKDKKKEKKEEDDLDELVANLDKKEEKVGKKGKKKQSAAAAEETESQPAAAAEGTESQPAAAAEGAESQPAAEQVAPAENESLKPDETVATEEKADEGKKKKNKKKKGGKAEEDDGEEKKEETEEVEEKEEEGEKPIGDMTEEERKKAEKKRKEKEKKKEKEKEKKEKEKKGGKKNKQVDMIKELLRAKQEAEEAEAKRIKEEEERYEALAKAQEEEDRLRKEAKEAEKKRKQERIETEKKAGTYLTPSQRAKRAQDMARLAALNLPLPLKEEEGAVEKPKKRILYDTKKKGKGAQQKDVEKDKIGSPGDSKPATPLPVEEKPEVVATPAAPAAAPVAPAVEEAAKEEEPVDDWEMDEVVVPPPAPAAAAPVAPEPAAATKTSPVAAATLTKGKSQESKEESDSESEESSSEEESSEDEDSSEEESSSEDEKKGGSKKETKEQIMEKVKLRLKKRREAAQAKRSVNDLRAPVICVLGHVDTGKTKMLDTIRRTNVQDGEAGGITQQIGATQVPGDAIKERCKNVRDFDPDKLRIPGFLIIDTPGHESFANLRSRGSSLCDFAILVVDIMHGLEQQTIESLKLLLKRGTPFVIALNKIDRLYGYESNPRKDVYQHLKSQPQNTQLEFTERYNKIVGEFAEQGVNVVLSNKNKNEEEYFSMVPTSAFLGDGIGNIMAHIAQMTQSRYAEKLAFCEELDATVMEVKAIAGLGTTIDVILVNGTLNVGDVIVLTGSDGAIMTPIRELLMPQPLKELRVKNEYGHYKQIKGAQGVKILAKGLEKALAGLSMFVVHKEDEIDVLREEAEAQLGKALMAIKKKPEGVYVQASTLGSLEALLEFLKSQKIPYSNVNIGPVHKRDVQKAAVMMEHNPEYACILAFDVRVEKDAQQFADHEGVKIFQADIIYHLEDNFLKYREELRLKARAENEHRAIFPCKLRVLPQHVFNARNPIVVGVSIEAGQLKKGTPICVPSKEGIQLGAISSIERNHEQVDLAKAGEEVCIKIENTTGEAPKLYGRHFTHEDPLISKLTRESIDVLKEHFREDLTRTDWQLVVTLKKLLDIF